MRFLIESFSVCSCEALALSNRQELSQVCDSRDESTRRMIVREVTYRSLVDVWMTNKETLLCLDFYKQHCKT